MYFRTTNRTCWQFLVIVLAITWMQHFVQAKPLVKSLAAERGYRFLTEKPYLPPDFDQESFDQLWRVWPKELKEIAESATPEQRRQLAYERYGLTVRSETDSRPLQYVVDEVGNWTMNCLSCHGGQILGKPYPGLPNSNYALETLTTDMRQLKLQEKKPLTRMEIGSLFMPLGRTNGTTNAVMFGVALMAYRDAELNVYPNRLPPPMMHHDMDAPPWWHFKRKSHIYIDGFAEKGARGLMQFMLIKENGPQQFRDWESDFEDVYAFLESIESPKYPFAIDHALAEQGRIAFNENCSECHGTYGDGSEFPNRMIPIDEISTDPVRHRSLTKKHRASYGASWFAHMGRQNTLDEPAGYVAPPLDGIWASAPYLHNGSVPTLWHMLRPDSRPVVWTRSRAGYDQERVGVAAITMDKVPVLNTEAERRGYFNTRKFGKKSTGHDYPSSLTDSERAAVLEYLKTL